MDPEALLEGLDDAQRAAVASTAMPLVVLAPAGSGKTRVLTRRIAHRVATGAADPRHVLAITFTRKAARELEQRLGRLGLRGDATVGTFHAVALRALEGHWHDEGRRAPTLLDRKARVLADLAPTVAGRDKRTTTADLAGEIEWAKARMVTPDDYLEAVGAARRRPPIRPELVAEAYAAYEARKRRGGLVDFDDLLALCARSLEDDGPFASAQRWRFRHLFVDELQDVNPLQFRLLEAWRGDRYDVTAVGDPQQAIYGWNGADPAFLTGIQQHWPPAEVIELVRCYRSTPEILGAAAAVLRTGRESAREVLSTRGSGEVPRITAHDDDRAEAVAIARAIRVAHAPGRPWRDQAVLVRTHAQTALIAEALRDAGVPHRVRAEDTDLPAHEDAVDLATFHAAKGLEWVTVHLAGIEAGYVPISRAHTAAAKAEEVRLLYVAMTRAQRDLRITWARRRTFAGRTVERQRSPLLDVLAAHQGGAPDQGAAPSWDDEVAQQLESLRSTRAQVQGPLDGLRAWRDSTARIARIAPETVLPDHVLARIVAATPRDVEALGAVPGVGPLLAARFGPAILDAMAEAAEPGGSR